MVNTSKETEKVRQVNFLGALPFLSFAREIKEVQLKF